MKQSPADFPTEHNPCGHSAAVFKKMSEPVGLNALSESPGKKAYLVTAGIELALPGGLTQFHCLYKRRLCLCPVRAIKAQSFASDHFIKA